MQKESQGGIIAASVSKATFTLSSFKLQSVRWRRGMRRAEHQNDIKDHHLSIPVTTKGSSFAQSFPSKARFPTYRFGGASTQSRYNAGSHNMENRRTGRWRQILMVRRLTSDCSGYNRVRVAFMRALPSVK